MKAESLSEMLLPLYRKRHYHILRESNLECLNLKFLQYSTTVRIMEFLMAMCMCDNDIVPERNVLSFNDVNSSSELCFYVYRDTDKISYE